MDIYSQVLALCHHQKHLRYFAKNAEYRVGGFIRNAEQFSELCSVANAGWDIYLHINPTTFNRGSPKANADEVTIFTNILLDVDVVDSSLLLPEIFQIFENTLDHLEDLLEESRNSARLVFSGRGFQAWIPFEPFQITTPKDAWLLTRSIKGLLQKLNTGVSTCKVDTSCSDLSRVARCPDTINTKTGQRSHILTIGSGNLLNVNDLLKFALPEPERPTFTLTNHDSVGYALPYVTARAADFLSSGVPSPGRHAAAYAAASSLRELSIPLELAETWITKGGQLCSPPLSPSECIRATRNAYRHENS